MSNASRKTHWLGLVSGLVWAGGAVLQAQAISYPSHPDGPGLVHASYLGGTDFEEGFGIAAGPDGSTYVTGLTVSPDFPVTTGAAAVEYRQDVFVARIAPSGALVQSIVVGGSDVEWPGGIAVDVRGHVWVTGSTSSPDFPLVRPLPSGGGTADAFLVELAPDLSQILLSTRLGGGQGDSGLGVALDAAGRIYVAGMTSSPDFPVVDAAFSTFRGWSDLFVTKIDPRGPSILYSTLVGGSSLDQLFGFDVDPAGHAYLVGDTMSPDFPTVQAVQPTLRGHDDGYVVKLDRSGSSLVYSTYLGGSHIDTAFAVVADAAGNATIAGDTWSTDFPTRAAMQPVSHGLPEAFVTRLSARGEMVFSTYFGGSESDRFTGIALDRTGAIYLTGYSTSADYPLAAPLQAECSPRYGTFCPTDFILTRLDRRGTSILFSTFLGGTSWEGGNDVAVGRHGEVHLLGTTSSDDAPTLRPFQPALAGDADAFIARLVLDRP